MLTLFYVCTKTICFNFCVNLNLCSEFTETLALTIQMDILDMILKRMDMDGSHNLAGGYGWIWISSIFWHGYGWLWINLSFLSMDMDGYAFYKPHPCQSLMWHGHS